MTLVPGGNAVDFGTLLEGDANDNNCVGITDLSVLAYGFTPCFNARADFNEDGLVNISDFSMLVSNFGRCGDIEVSAPSAGDSGEGWQP